ncbi:hypothetical protein WMY93_031633 [Mugilogobius chulae]|uniref:Chromo domain-containing protein n=1 Tax=Mugilogobius chulae TaxID=88201 RepID=A0AAW0MH28_9GOBI
MLLRVQTRLDRTGPACTRFTQNLSVHAPAVSMETEEDLYEVERIVDRRRSCQGQVQYLVRWRGFGSDCDTWEPEEHLQTCSPHVQEFNQRLLKEVRHTRHTYETLERHMRHTALENMRETHGNLKNIYRPAPSCSRVQPAPAQRGET